MRRLLRYLREPAVVPATQTCRVKVWAHDHAFTLFWITSMNIIGWVVTVVQCH